MNRYPKTTAMKLIGALLALLVLPAKAPATNVGDITHLQGSRTNRIVGMGLVIGLAGTGDGGKYAPAMRPLAQLYERFANPVFNLDELKNAKNVAIVQVEATLPRDGVSEGQQVDVTVSSIGAAKSLNGGRLVLTPLMNINPQDPNIWAWAGGHLQIEDDEVPTVARIAKGATVERDHIHNYIALGRDLAIYQQRSTVRPLHWIRPDEPYVTFVINESHAGWSWAYAIAQSINEEFSIPDEMATGNTNALTAMALDPGKVVVHVSQTERANPAGFLARLEVVPVYRPLTETRVTINHKSEAIIIDGDVEISPTVISFKGLTITTLIPEPEPTQGNPRVVQSNFLAVDPQKKGGPKLKDLIEALSQLQVPAKDRITIIEMLYEQGNLHATLRVER